MMDTITQALNTFSAWAIGISAIMAALTAICKPLRPVLASVRKKLFGATTSDQILSEIKVLKTDVQAVSDKCDEVSKKNDANERDRLKDSIFRYGNYARKGQPISGEEYRNLQQVFEKYTSLGGNDIAHDEYNFVTDYYNHKRWKEKNYE